MPIRKRLAPDIDYNARYGDEDTPPFRWLDTAHTTRKRSELKAEFKAGKEYSPFPTPFGSEWTRALPNTIYLDKRLSQDDYFGILGRAIIWNGRQEDGNYNDTRQWRGWVERRDDHTLLSKKANYIFLGTFATREDVSSAAKDHFAFMGKKTRPRKFKFIAGKSDIGSTDLANINFNTCSQITFLTKEEEVKGYQGKGKLKAKPKLRKRLRKS